MAMEDRLCDLALVDGSEEGFEFPELGGEAPSAGYELCLVGMFLTDKTINFLVMKHRMVSLWRPGRGVIIKDLGSRLILIHFQHPIDLRWVMDNGP